MINKRTIGAIMLSLLLAILAAWFANNWVSSRLSGSEVSEGDQSEMVPVVVAALDISYGQIIEAQHLRIEKIPVNLAPVGIISDLNTINGFVAKREIVTGEIILMNHVTDSAQGNVLSALIGENKRAVTVRVNDVVGVGGFLLPGNYVDVLSAKKYKNRVSTTTVLQKIKVLAVDQKAKADSKEPTVVRSVTLEVSPNEAEKLVTAQTEGTIQLSLRNPNEQLVEKVMAAAPKRVAPKSVRRKVVRSTDTVTIIRGTSEEKKMINIL